MLFHVTRFGLAHSKLGMTQDSRQRIFNFMGNTRTELTKSTHLFTLDKRSLGGHEGWFLAFDGEQEGPLSLTSARERVTREAGREAYAWRAGFSSWLLAEEVPELRLLGRAPLQPARVVNGGRSRLPSGEETRPEKRQAKALLDADRTDGTPRDTHSDIAVSVPQDTGPEPLAIAEWSEPVALQDVAQPNPLGAPLRRALDSFASISNSVARLSPAPVVVVSGKRDDFWHARLTWIAAGLGVLVLALFGLVVVALTRAPAKVQDVAQSGGRPADDRPIAIQQPGRPLPDPLPDPKSKSVKWIKAPAKSTPPTFRSAAPSTFPAAIDDKGEHAVPTVAPRNSAPVQMSQNAILEVVNRNKRSLNLCYQRVLKHDSSLKHGKLTTHVKVGISGNVSEVSIPNGDLANSELGTCIKQAIKAWHFPSADAEYQTEFPIILQAQ